MLVRLLLLAFHLIQVGASEEACAAGGDVVVKGNALLQRKTQLATQIGKTRKNELDNRTLHVVINTADELDDPGACIARAFLDASMDPGAWDLADLPIDENGTLVPPNMESFPMSFTIHVTPDPGNKTNGSVSLRQHDALGPPPHVENDAGWQEAQRHRRRRDRRRRYVAPATPRPTPAPRPKLPGLPGEAYYRPFDGRPHLPGCSLTAIQGPLDKQANANGAGEGDEKWATKIVDTVASPSTASAVLSMMGGIATIGAPAGGGGLGIALMGASVAMGIFGGLVDSGGPPPITKEQVEEIAVKKTQDVVNKVNKQFDEVAKCIGTITSIVADITLRTKIEGQVAAVRKLMEGTVTDYTSALQHSFEKEYTASMAHDDYHHGHKDCEDIDGERRAVERGEYGPTALQYMAPVIHDWASACYVVYMGWLSSAALDFPGQHEWSTTKILGKMQKSLQQFSYWFYQANEKMWSEDKGVLRMYWLYTAGLQRRVDLLVKLSARNLKWPSLPPRAKPTRCWCSGNHIRFGVRRYCYTTERRWAGQCPQETSWCNKCYIPYWRLRNYCQKCTVSGNSVNCENGWAPDQETCFRDGGIWYPNW